jgi:flagellar hook-associated protein 2
MAMSVDGLVSGLNTTEMVNQLMQVEALPQTALKNKVTAQNKAVTAYQDINTKLAAMTTAAKALESGDSWNPVKASSSSDAAIVTTTASARPGTLTFKVDQVAAAHTVLMAGRVTSPTDANQPAITGVSFVAPGADGTPVTVTPATRSLKDVAAAINEKNLAYRATVVQTQTQPTSEYTLQLTSVKAGTAGTINPTGIPDNLGSAVDVWPGSDAEITVGDPNDPMTASYTLKSATNTFTDVIPGVTVTLTKMPTDPDVTISTTADPGATADKVQAFVDAANAALAQIKTATAAKSGSTAAGALAGDPTLRALGQEILSAVATGTGTLSLPGNFAEVGITVERGGTLKFDRSKFTTAYEANPTRTREYFDKHTPVTGINGHGSPTVFEPGWDTAHGIARKLSTIGLKATEGLVMPDNPTASREGIVTGLINRRNDAIKSLNDQVKSWDVRLETRRNALQRQYSALEVALGKLKEQQSWLSGQLAGLS